MPEPETPHPMPETEPTNPPAVAEVEEKPTSGRHDLASRPEERADTTHAPERVYFLLADATEGPTAPVDADVVTRRAARAMERLLGGDSAGRAVPAVAPARARRGR